MTAERTVDALGTHCPVPVRLLARAMGMIPTDGVVRLLADDPIAAIDVPAWCHTHGCVVSTATNVDGMWTFVVRRSG